MIRLERQVVAVSGSGWELNEVTTLEGLASLRGDWDRLVETLEAPTPFHSWTWNWSWWKHFGRGALRILVIRRQGQVRGIAQFHERRHGGLVTSLAPIGWGNRLTEHLDLIFPESDHDELLQAVTAWLGRQRCTWTWLPGLRPGSTEVVGGPVANVFENAVPFEYLDLPGSWEVLVAGLNKSMRDNVKYYPKLMLRNGHDFRFRVAGSPTEVCEALPTLFRLHNLRAGMQGGVGHRDYLKDSSHQEFLGEVMPALAVAGQAKIGLLEVGEEVVAAISWLEREDSICLYYTGFEPSWSKYSVVTVATSEVLKYAIVAGIRRIDFLRGTDPFKRRWGTTQRMTVEVAVAKRPALVRPVLRAAVAGRRRLRHLRHRLATTVGPTYRNANQIEVEAAPLN
jgi:CelD/BcsL family acetyltransferase involved in cellulose biosynthesis